MKKFLLFLSAGAATATLLYQMFKGTPLLQSSVSGGGSFDGSSGEDTKIRTMTEKTSATQPEVKINKNKGITKEGNTGNVD